MTVQRSVERIGAVTSKYFVVWILVVSPLALYSPESFIWIEPYITPLLGIIMLGMGLTLTPDDFRRILERPRDVFIGALGQWLLMPTIAYVLVTVLELPAEIGLGLILVGAAPGGTASNVMTYLGRGDVALSVSITSVTTIAAPLVMPAWIVLLAGESITITFATMATSIVQVVLLPVVVGLVLRHLLDAYAPAVAQLGLSIFPAISVIAIVAIVAAVVGLSVETILGASASSSSRSSSTTGSVWGPATLSGTRRTWPKTGHGRVRSRSASRTAGSPSRWRRPISVRAPR